jgi:hypothetical protein
LLCFVCFWFVVLALHHHLTTFRTGFKTAELVDNITSHVFDFTSSRIGQLIVYDWFVVNIKMSYGMSLDDGVTPKQQTKNKQNKANTKIHLILIRLQ